jgi:hypothetical protein
MIGAREVSAAQPLEVLLVEDHGPHASRRDG